VGLKCVITAAEPLSQAQREVLGQAYGCGIFNRYGSRECGLIAMECSRHRGLHVDCENLWIDLHERPGLSGARTIVVTKLTEMVMPMIRYDQADYTTAPLGECDCGRCYPVLSDVGGRRLALLHRTDGATVPGEVMVALFGAMPLRSYRVVQQADRSIDVELAPDAGFDDSARGEIDKHLRRLLGDLPCRVRVGESVQTAPSGKLLPVVSYYQPQEAA
jgi:phenylacetate-CoA ligase